MGATWGDSQASRRGLSPQLGSVSPTSPPASIGGHPVSRRRHRPQLLRASQSSTQRASVPGEANADDEDVDPAHRMSASVSDSISPRSPGSASAAASSRPYQATSWLSPTGGRGVGSPWATRR